MREKKIVIIDYGIGNIRSIFNAFVHLGIMPNLTADKKSILEADALVLPGVGAFSKGMSNLSNADLTETIKAFVRKGNPFIGICLGMQMLFEESDEFGVTPGLGLLKGKVTKLRTSNEHEEKLPHVSWNELNEPYPGRWNDTFFDGLSLKSDAYFVHSYVGVPENTNVILATSNYGGSDFCAAVHHDNIYGTQFHPEKSGANGLHILKNFII
jgi:glutamine amidotransferase